MCTVYDVAMEIRGVMPGQKSVTDVIGALLKGVVVGFICDGMCKTSLGIILKPMMAIFGLGSQVDQIQEAIKKGDPAEIEDGDVLRTKDGETEAVESVRTERLDEAVRVYNLEIEESHTYYVSADGVLVHNECGDTLPSNARRTSNEDEIFMRLEKYHGVDKHKVSKLLHEIKKANGRGGADNVLFDLTGGVYDPVTLEYIGNLIK